MNDSASIRHPWYKIPIVWLIIALPAASVIAGVGLVIVAYKNQDSVVRDDWYKEGKAINQNIARDQTATQIGQEADIRIDDLTGEIQVALAKPGKTTQLQLLISHPTQAEQDETLILQQRNDGTYHGALTHALKGRYYIELGSAEWRLLGDKEFPLTSVHLSHEQ